MRGVRGVHDLQGSASTSTTVETHAADSAQGNAAGSPASTMTPFSGGGAAVGRTERTEEIEQARNETVPRTDPAEEAVYALDTAMRNHMLSGNLERTREGFGPPDVTTQDIRGSLRPLTAQLMAMLEEGRQTPLYGEYTSLIDSTNMLFGDRIRNPTGGGGTGPVGGSDTKPRGSGDTRTQLKGDRNSLEVTLGRSRGTAISVVMATTDNNKVRVFWGVMTDESISTNANNLGSFNGESVTFSAINARTWSEIIRFSGSGLLTSMDIAGEG